MASFGWSVGDIIAAITVVTKIVSALKDTGGASEQYRQTIQDLEILEIVLRQLQNVKPEDANFAQANAICARSQASQRALRDLLDGFQRFEKALCSGAPTGWHRGAHRKVQWALIASKELDKFQASIGMQLQSIMLLLQCQQLSSIHSTRKNLDQQMNAIEELRNGVVALNTAHEISRKSEMRQLTRSFASAQSAKEKTSMERRLTSERKQETDLQSRRVVSKLEDIKSSVDLLGQLVVENNRHMETDVDTNCPNLQKSQDNSAPDTYQAAIHGLMRHIYQLLYLIYLSMRDLLQKAVLVYPQIRLFLELCYASIPPSPTRLLADNILLTDAFGRQISLDYTIFKSWPVFSEFVLDQFRGTPAEQHVLQGKYLLFLRKNPDRLISSLEWGSELSPGAQVSMSVGLSGLKFDGKRCPKLSCGRTIALSLDGRTLKCLSCSLDSYSRKVTSMLLPCSTPLCSGVVRLNDAVSSARCQICGLMTSSNSVANNLDQAKITHSVRRFIDLEDDTDDSSVIMDEIEKGLLVDEDVEEKNNSLDVGNAFMPITIGKSDLALTLASSDINQKLETTILNAKRRKLQLLQARMESFRREEEETNCYRQQKIEQTAIESLKTVHLILDTTLSESSIALQSTRLLSAQKLLQARMNLLQTLQTSQPPALKKHSTDTVAAIGFKDIKKPSVGTVFEILENDTYLPNHQALSCHQIGKIFVGIRETTNYLICLGISTYDGLGTTEPSVDSSTHALIYNSKAKPPVFPEEITMKPPIMVFTDDRMNRLDPMARVSLAKVYNIRSEVTWKHMGQVQGEALRSLEDSFNKCFKQNFELSEAASEGKTKKAIRLLAGGADPNAVVGIYGNALFEALLAGHYQVADILLAKGAAPYLGFGQKMTSAPLFQAISRGNVGMTKSIVKRSICTHCYQQPNQRMLINRAANALAGCEEPGRHWKDFRTKLRWYCGDINSFQNEFEPNQIRQEAARFCPQLWPLLVYLPATTIAMYRADIFSRYQICELSISQVPTQNEVDILKVLKPYRDYRDAIDRRLKFRVDGLSELKTVPDVVQLVLDSEAIGWFSQTFGQS